MDLKCFLRRAAILLLILILIGWLFPRDVFGHTLDEGNLLVPVTVEKKGEVSLAGKKLKFKAWNSESTLGERLAFVQHLAGRLGIEELNKPLSDAIVELNLPPELLDSVIIINADDSAFGTGWLISSEIKDNKRIYPDAIFVHDAEGVVAKQWHIKPKTANSMIVAANGTILFHKEGETTPDDVRRAVNLIKTNLPDSMLASSKQEIIDTTTASN